MWVWIIIRLLFSFGHNIIYKNRNDKRCIYINEEIIEFTAFNKGTINKGWIVTISFKPVGFTLIKLYNISMNATKEIHMNYKDKILEYLKNNNGIITIQHCREEGIPTIYLTRLLRENILTRIDRGIYISKDGDYDEYYFFHRKIQKDCIFLWNSSILQRLTDKTPQVKELISNLNYKVGLKFNSIYFKLAYSVYN